MGGTFLNLLLIASIASLAILSSCDKNDNNNNIPVADFEASEINIYKGEQIFFNDLSSNTPTEWSWDFGDESTSIEQNPTHIYDLLGVYTVKLTVSNIDGSDTEIKTNYISVLSIVTAGTGLSDINGNNYTSTIIGGQEWMAENLNVANYPNGDAIPFISDNTAWANLAEDNISDAYCYYNNNASGEADTYGALYTYAAAIGDNWARDNTDGQGVCPNGWHLPTNVEWEQLEDCLKENGYSYDGVVGNDGIAKSLSSNSGWIISDIQGAVGNSDFSEYRNKTGFSALPGGYRSYGSGTFGYLGDLGRWWSATERTLFDIVFVYHRSFNYNEANVTTSSTNGKSIGFSVRCVKD